MDILTHQKVAIKKISHATKAEQEAKHALREIRLMRYLGVHDNIMTLKGLSMREKSDELYIVMEYADTDLHRVIQSKQLLTEEHRQYFIFQILRAVEFIHKHNVIHRDLYVKLCFVLILSLSLHFSISLNCFLMSFTRFSSTGSREIYSYFEIAEFFYLISVLLEKDQPEVASNT